MLTYPKNSIDAFKTIIVVDIPYKSRDDVFTTSFDYEISGFIIANMPDFKNFEDLIAHIDPHGEVCEGVGYDAYCNEIKNRVLTCIDSSTSASFIVPLMNNGTRRNFLMNVIKKQDKISLLFVYLNNASALNNIDTFLAGAYKDRLTGLFNYNTLMTHLSNNDRNGYLVLFDLNDFKKVNDTLGHSAGDDVLLHLSSYLIGISNENHIFYRRSGDEFVILVFRQDFAYIEQLIKQIECYLESLNKDEIKSLKDAKCSAAFGILELAYDREEQIDSYSQNKLTDLAMYQAKKSHKLYHYISFNDAIEIIKKGDLHPRLMDLSKEISRHH